MARARKGVPGDPHIHHMQVLANRYLRRFKGRFRLPIPLLKLDGLDGPKTEATMVKLQRAVGYVPSAANGQLDEGWERRLAHPLLRATRKQRKRGLAYRRKIRAAARQRAVRPREAIVTSVRNQSARSDAIRLIVLHSTESDNRAGLGDLRGVISWFDNPRAEASAHVIVDADGNAAQCVPDARKAWHVAQFNSIALGIEQVGHAAQTDWPEAQIEVVAQYIAYWSRAHGVPIAHSTSHGVCMHSELGAAGGGHHDPGPDYPLARVLELARTYR